MSFIKRKLAGAFFESKEIKPKKIIKNRIEDIKNNIKTSFHKSELEEPKNNKNGEEFVDQNSNSNINILNIYKIDQNKHITDKKLIKNNNIEFNMKNRLSLKEENPKLNKKGLFSSSIKNNESFSFYKNIQPDKPQNKYNKHKMRYIFPYYYFLLDCIFDKFLPRKFLCVPKTYFIVYNYMGQIYDISSHIILYKQVDILKKAFERQKYQNQEEITSIGKFHKINIRHSRSIE